MVLEVFGPSAVQVPYWVLVVVLIVYVAHRADVRLRIDFGINFGV